MGIAACVCLVDLHYLSQSILASLYLSFSSKAPLVVQEPVSPRLVKGKSPATSSVLL